MDKLTRALRGELASIARGEAGANTDSPTYEFYELLEDKLQNLVFEVTKSGRPYRPTLARVLRQLIDELRLSNLFLIELYSDAKGNDHDCAPPGHDVLHRVLREQVLARMKTPRH